MNKKTLFIQRLGKETGTFLYKLTTNQVPLQFEEYEKHSISWGRQLKVRGILLSQGLITTLENKIILNKEKINQL